MTATAPEQIKACVFDMGKVLIHFCHDRMLRQMAVVCDCEPEQLRQLLFDSGVLLEYERGLHTEEQIHQLIEQTLGKSVDRAALEFASADIFDQFDEMLPVIESLKNQQMPLVLLSNTSRVHFESIRDRFPILTLFDHYVLSYEVRTLKPDPGIYEHAVSLAGQPAPNCFFTDDIAVNVEGARHVGLQAVQFKNPSQLINELRSRGVMV
ncbi:MAG: HAD family phosphatase [Planctomycetaceae bacterium]|nr:HAD family phosphatase [Planctomycetaceae bacterium]